MTEKRSGFTLLELMLAISIMAVVSAVTYMSFSTVTTAWKIGVALTDSLNNGDHVAEQLVMALRSAYYPEARGTAPQYGFWNEDDGDGEYSHDMISWVKLGNALVGEDCAFAGSPHRVRVTIEDNEDGEPAVAVRAWRLHGQPDDFEPDDVEPLYLSTKIVGFNCRSAWRKVHGEIEWFDEWEDTNRVPTVLELTFWLKPPKEGDPPIEMKRAIGIRGAAISWRNR
ncbi:type II secretion system protein J [Verrucomicrobiota bacterium]